MTNLLGCCCCVSTGRFPPAKILVFLPGLKALVIEIKRTSLHVLIVSNEAHARLVLLLNINQAARTRRQAD